jgi:hypothetical protein
MAAEADEKESTLNAINSLCDQLNFLTSPNIEEKMGCTFDCCIGNYVPFMVETLIENEKMHYLFGQEGLKLLRQLNRRLSDVMHDDEEGFSKKQGWLGFVEFANKVNIFLKDTLNNNKYDGS